MVINLLHSQSFIHTYFYLGTVAPLVCSTIFILVLSADLQYYLESREQNVQQTPINFFFNGGVLSVFSLIVVIILVLLIIVSPMVVFSGIQSGDIDRNSCCDTLHEHIEFDRLNNETITIQMKQNPDNYLEWAPKPVFHISVNGFDLSNMDTIEKQGLSDRIDPPEGLVYANSSMVILKGPEISNKTQACHVLITEQFSKRTKRITADFKV